MRIQLQAPPPTGPPRLAWWDAWRAAIAHDALWSAQRAAEYGWSVEDVDDHLDHYRAHLLAQIDYALDEARVLVRWASS